MKRRALPAITKEPLAGRAKPRLLYGPGEAAALAGASLLDTLDAIARPPAEPAA